MEHRPLRITRLQPEYTKPVVPISKEDLIMACAAKDHIGPDGKSGWFDKLPFAPLCGFWECRHCGDTYCDL